MSGEISSQTDSRDCLNGTALVCWCVSVCLLEIWRPSFLVTSRVYIDQLLLFFNLIAALAFLS